LLDRINISFQSFTLANGLRVVVHTDRKAPVVAVSIWYNVGSKDEPAGRTGFAHLFEHLMFNGSENAPGDYFTYTSAIGATDLNGQTLFDWTKYYQTVPTPALERALFLESDRMGHLLGALTQEALTNQISVVLNEKRQRHIDPPFGMVEFVQTDELFPRGHPYGHTTIGSTADISASTLDTVRGWFQGHYGPNNAVLVLAGDIDAATARPMVERQFGDIPRGPVNVPAAASVPTLLQRIDRAMHDHVANTRLYRTWVVPGLTDESQVPLDVAATILGGLASSRLDNALVRGEESAVRVTAGLQPFQRISEFEVTVDVKPGQDVDAVGRRLDQIIAGFVAQGPTQDEIDRTVTTLLAAGVRGLEQVNGKATALAEGMLYADNPGFYHHQLERLARVTPAEVQAAMRRWLTRPVLALRVDPGEREPYQEALAQATTAQADPDATAAPRGAARTMPAVADAPGLDLPPVARAQLSNGIWIVYAQRTAIPVTRMVMEFDAGTAADTADRRGLQRMMTGLLTEGTTSRNANALAEAQERLGAQIGASVSLDRTSVVLNALTPNLGASLDLFADIVRNPGFADQDVERLRAQMLAAISSELTQPQGLVARALPPLLYGPGHPYGRPGGAGDAVAVRAFMRDDVTAAHQRWIRPDNATLFVVSDLPLAQVQAQLEVRFGNWQAPAGPRGTKDFPAVIPAARPRIVLIDRPQSPQSLIVAAEVLDADGRQDLFDLNAANDVIAGDFLARLNMDLRERRGWSYGVRGGVGMREHRVSYTISAPVQADRTGESIAALRELLSAFPATSGTQPAELERVIESNTRTLPGQFQTSQALLGSMVSNALLGRPDDYYETLAARYRHLTAAELDAAAHRYLHPDRLVWVVVGDASVVRPQLEHLGLPIETVQPD